VDGNGQRELVDAIVGDATPAAGRVLWRDRDVTATGRAQRRALGMAHVPADRQRHGLVLDFTLAENLALRDYREGARFGLISPGRMAARAKRLLEEFDVRGGDPQTPARSLSGGNQQKVVIAREIAGNPEVLVAAQPTRGLDVGAIEFVHRRLVEERDAGRGVLLVSLELEEIRSLSDRVLVIYEGEIVAELPPESSEEDFGVVMTGGGRKQAA
jgi:simple sugar transport system ATP-binding protein